MAWKIADTVRNARMDAITAKVDAGAAGGFFRLYDGTQPAKGGAATLLLAEFQFSATSFGAAAAGTITANAMTDEASAPAGGTVQWARIVDSAGVFVADGTITVDFTIDNAVIALNQAVNSGTISFTDGNA